MIRSLNFGGAERQLVTLAKALSEQHQIYLLHFYGGPLEQELKGSGVEVISLQKKGRWDLVGFFFRLIENLKQIKPQILHGYMDGPNILSVFVKLFCPGMKIIWGIRASFIDFSRSDLFVRMANRAERILSRFADLIIFNSKAGLQFFQANGFPKSKSRVVPNGIDIHRFRPNDILRKKFREELNIPEDCILIGNVGRMVPQKDHKTFLKAAQLFNKSDRKIRFLCIGAGPEEFKNELVAYGEGLDLGGNILWLKPRNQMEEVYAGLDILTLCSLGEGFSNVIGEAMACGVPCVVTDVGDSAWIVGSYGFVIPTANPEALSRAWGQCIEQLGPELREPVRKRIEECFSVEHLVGQMNQTFLHLADMKE